MTLEANIVERAARWIRTRRRWVSRSAGFLVYPERNRGSAANASGTAGYL